MGSVDRVPAIIGWGKGKNVIFAGWQVMLCDHIRHVTFCNGKACCKLLYFTYFNLPATFQTKSGSDIRQPAQNSSIHQSPHQQLSAVCQRGSLTHFCRCSFKCFNNDLNWSASSLLLQILSPT